MPSELGNNQFPLRPIGDLSDPSRLRVPPPPTMVGTGDIMTMFLVSMIAPGDLPFVNGLFGRTWVVFMYERNANPRAQAILQAFRDVHTRLKNSGIGVLAISRDHWESHRQTAGRLGIPFPLLSDPEGCILARTGYAKLARSQGADFVGVTLVVDPFYHIAAVSRETEAAAHMTSVVAAVEKLEQAKPKAEPIYSHAPVLLLSNVLEPEVCRYLLAHYETFGGRDSGFMVTNDRGKTVGKIDYGTKIRSDHFIEDSDVKKALDWRLGYRMRPEIRKAFQFDPTRREDLKIICYDSKKGGYFRPHRDNTSPSTAHRRWAVTVNLNSEECEGGYLRFPEFGPMLYKPRTGDAVVFSSSLLHEVTDVTAGRRFALTTFFYGEKELASKVPINPSDVPLGPSENDA